MMLSFSHHLLSRTLKYRTHIYFNKNWVQHRRRKRLYTREDTSIKEGKLSYIDILNKYTVTAEERSQWKFKLDKISDSCGTLNRLRDGLFKRAFARRRFFLKENSSLYRELQEKNKLIQKLERRQKRYTQAIDMYNYIIAEYESH